LFVTFLVPAIGSFQQGSFLQNTVQEASSTLQLAQNRTLASEGANQYGVYFDTASSPHSFIMFEGSSYATRNTTADEVHVLREAVEISSIGFTGGSEVVFERITGSPEQSGFVTFRLADDVSQTQSVNVLDSGAIETGISSSPSLDDLVRDSRHVTVAYQGRDISTGSEDVRLVFADTTYSIDIVSNMRDGQIFWEGEVTSNGEPQVLKIHTLFLNDPGEGTLFSLHRQGDQNTRAVSIELSGDASGDLVSYDDTGVSTPGTSIYASSPQLQ